MNTIVDTIFLGTYIDAEPDGQPDPNALGDDNNGTNDDEDGVNVIFSLYVGGTGGFEVIASTAGFLNAWIDYNQNGSWAEANEQIFIDELMFAGNNWLFFVVPADAFVGNTYARFRFSTVSGLTYTGPAPDGEVEDYEVSIDIPYKWAQYPDLSELGLDVDATYDLNGQFDPLILADDFLCNITGPLTRIDIWGSWYLDHYPWYEDPGAVQFTLSIHEDIPADQNPLGYSMPGEILWQYTYQPGEFMIEQYAFDLTEGWFNPSVPFYEPFGDTECWLYSFDIPPDPDGFIQQGTTNEPEIYWLDVQAQPMDDDPECRFGWKTSVDNWNDNAVWTVGTEPYTGNWNELEYPDGHPLFGLPIDLAFAVSGQENQHLLVNLNVFLEGSYIGTGMHSLLNPYYLPLSQPYNNAPWYYSGTEHVVAIPCGEVTDWVLVELRDAPDPASATGSTILAQQAAFLLNNGSIVGLDCVSDLLFYNTIINQLFVVIWHRNHLGVMSAAPLIESGGVYSYDFTSGEGQVYGGITGYKEIGTGVWGMVTGDGNADGIVNTVDKISVWTIEAGLSGYLQSDFNLDGQTNNPDKNDAWFNNLTKESQVPD